MASEEKNKKDEVKIGFAGLLSMVSDVEAMIAHATTMKPESRPETQRSAQTEPKTNQQSYQSARGLSTEKLLLIGFGVVLVLWLSSILGPKFIEIVGTRFREIVEIPPHVQGSASEHVSGNQGIDVKPTPTKNDRLEPGAIIQATQQKLNEHGYNAGKADGIMGAKTRAAITTFQKDNNLRVDGIASAELLQKLDSKTSKKKQQLPEKQLEPSAAQKPSNNLTKTGYDKDYKKLRTDGLSTVTIDNSRNSSPVSAKLFYTDGIMSVPIRVISIKSGDSFTIRNIQPGKYDVRYQSLDTGSIYKSDPFFLEEQTTETGTRYSNIRMTLYTVNNGNMQMKHISRGEFE